MPKSLNCCTLPRAKSLGLIKKWFNGIRPILTLKVKEWIFDAIMTRDKELWRKEIAIAAVKMRWELVVFVVVVTVFPSRDAPEVYFPHPFIMHLLLRNVQNPKKGNTYNITCTYFQIAHIYLPKLHTEDNKCYSLKFVPRLSSSSPRRFYPQVTAWL